MTVYRKSFQNIDVCACLIYWRFHWKRTTAENTDSFYLKKTNIMFILFTILKCSFHRYGCISGRIIDNQNLNKRWQYYIKIFSLCCILCWNGNGILKRHLIYWERSINTVSIDFNICPNFLWGQYGALQIVEELVSIMCITSGCS